MNDIMSRQDRIGKYFRKYLDRFVFAEFSEEFITKSASGDQMRGVPIPLRGEQVQEFAGNEGVSLLNIADNMAWVIGCDPHFVHAKSYAAFLNGVYDGKIEEGFIKVGKDAAERGDFDNACVHFRAALCLNPDSLQAMYSYARACRSMYLASENEEYVGRFKAEALDWFEMLTEVHPDFPKGYYYLGYAYLNMGLYAKANISWKKFMKLTRVAEDKKEIRKRLQQLEEPLMVEAGCNHIMAGRYEEGLLALETFKESRFRDWWPLYYYLGVAYEMTGSRAEAQESFRKVLKLNGSHIETMKELVLIYEAEGDEANAKKYTEKIKMIQAGMEEDRQINLKAIEEEDRKLQEEEPEFLEPERIDVLD